MKRTPLRDGWEFRLEGEAPWQPMHVPGCWEELGIPKDHPGPGWYRYQLTIPPEVQDKRVWLHFEGVSYHCILFINGREITSHTGTWDAFRVDITEGITPGEATEVLLRVEKPASLRSGPASDPVPGAFPLKETLAGFLPYVWGHLFGGIWQDVYLAVTDKVAFQELYVHGDELGHVKAELSLSKEAHVQLEILDPDGKAVLTAGASGTTFVMGGHVPTPQLWSPARPVLYQARLSISGGEERTVTFGFRTLQTAGTTLLLNGQAIYPRLALSWGWYTTSLHSNPGREQVRHDLLQLKALGYNGVKLCLWVPPQYYFDIADELGMLLWLELPMWLPKPTEFFKRQTPHEYKRIVQQVRHHPSLIIYSLGCELNRDMDAALLGTLYHEVKGLIGDALLRDNSGSGEAYGGLLNEFAEYYDYHFYSDIQFFRHLVDYFTPRWRPVQPWVFGEFCDLDTFRDLRQVYAANGGEKPWWTCKDQTLNPKGARWQYDVVDQEARLKQNGFWERGEELEVISNKQALLHRKFTLELVRSYREVSGYVITGERDTPISTAGMWNELGELKFPAAAFRAFNQDVVLTLGWDKRRAWVAGGDRAAYWDTFSYPAGALVRPHLVVSHYGSDQGPAELRWRVTLPDGTPLADEEHIASLVEPGTVRELTVAEFTAPQLPEPVQLTFHAAVKIGQVHSENSWPLWVFPAQPWAHIAPVMLHDPQRRLEGLQDLVPFASATRVQIATEWSAELKQHVRHGGAVVLLLTGKETLAPAPTQAMPFWREAVKVIEPHPAWGDFPHEGWVDLQFFGLATDHVLDTNTLEDVRPILRRVDARTMQVHDYAVEVPLGRGQLILSTLRFDGGLGEQPVGLKRNTAAAYLLSRWVKYLQDG